MTTIQVTKAYTHKQDFQQPEADIVYIDVESPVDDRGNAYMRNIISSLGYTDNRHEHLEYVKFSKKCAVSDIMAKRYNSPPTEVYKQGRTIVEALSHLHKFAKGRTLVTFGNYDEQIIRAECERHNLNLDFTFLDFTECIAQPKNMPYSLSLQRVLDLLPLTPETTQYLNTLVDHNPLGDAIKLMVAADNYADTPSFRQGVYDIFKGYELKALLKQVNATHTRLAKLSSDFLSDTTPETVPDILLTALDIANAPK